MRSPFLRFTVLLAALASSLAGLAQAQLVVDSEVDLPDALPGDGQCEAAGSGACTLRAAIQETNALGGGTVVLPAGLFLLTLAGTSENLAATGDLDLLASVTLQGSGVDETTIDAGALDRVLDVRPGAASVAIEDLTVQHGSTPTGSHGGGIRSNGSLLTLTGVRVFDNDADNLGGGIFSCDSCELSLLDSEVSSNRARHGGGIHSSGVLSLVGSVAADNEATESSGGIRSGGPATLEDSVVSDNRAAFSAGVSTGGAAMTLLRVLVSGNEAISGNGGGLSAAGVVELVNSTVSGNEAARSGGGISSDADLLTLHNTTIADNVAAAGAGLYVTANTQELRLGNSVIADNRTGAGEASDCLSDPTLVSEGYNLIESPTGCALGGDLTGNLTGDPQLGPLAPNGGPSDTHHPMAGSPLIDAGDPAGCADADGAGLAEDQRGEPRPFDGDGDETARCDVGAVEVQFVPEPPGRALASAALAILTLLARRRTARGGTRPGRPL